MSIQDYFAKVDATIPALKQAKTPDEVIAILLTLDPPSSAEAFWRGDGDELLGALYDAGWKSHAYEAPYYWVLTAPNGEHLSYTEGDVHKGDNESCRGGRT